MNPADISRDKVQPEAGPVFVSAQACLRVLSWRDVIEALRQAYSVPHGPSMSPPRVVARGDKVTLRTLVAAPSGGRFMGAKVFGRGRNGGMNYLIALIDQETGLVAAMVDGKHVTAFRTAGTSALAVDRLAPRQSLSLGVLGSGLEATSHVRAIAAVRNVKSLKVFSPTPERRENFASNFAAELGIPADAVDTAQAAVADCDLVVGAARSRDETPILRGAWLRPGTTVVSVGSTLPEQREIDADLVRAADIIVCDAVDEVADETGDMLAAASEGVAFREKMVSLNDLLCGRHDDAAAAARLPLFKSVGSAVQDIVVAELALGKALAEGFATRLPISFESK